MKMLNRPTLALTILSIAFASSLKAQSDVSTDPVAAISIEFPDSDDTVLGMQVHQPTEYAGVTTGVTSGTVSVDGTPFTADQFNNAHYLWITSGTLSGNWYAITDTLANGLVVAEDLETFGLVAADTVKVIPFWTLNTLFPNGEGIAASPDGNNPVATVQVNNVSEIGVNLTPSNVYFYHDGSVIAAGWYETGTFDASDNAILNPETYFTVRNQSGATTTLTYGGGVPIDTVATEVGRLADQEQDNRVVNPYPVAFTLDNSGLLSVVEMSPDGSNPVDTVEVFDNSLTGINPTPAKAYFYHDGSVLAAGWYETGTFDASGAVQMPGGGAFIVRKGDGTAGTNTWNPPKPY